MVDNIKLFVPRCRDMPDIGCYLDSGAVEKVNIKTGEVMIQGNVDNIKVSQLLGGYSIQGSLPKLLYGNNVCQLTRKDIGVAIEKLSDRLHLPLYDADITKIGTVGFFWRKVLISLVPLPSGRPKSTRAKAIFFAFTEAIDWSSVLEKIKSSLL